MAIGIEDAVVVQDVTSVDEVAVQRCEDGALGVVQLHHRFIPRSKWLIYEGGKLSLSSNETKDNNT
jgi:hypothetical protein